MIGTGGAMSAALAILPGVIAAMIVLLDLGAQSVLGFSGFLVALLPSPAGGSGGLPGYAGTDRAALIEAGAGSVLRAVPGLLLVAAALAQSWSTRIRNAAACVAIVALVVAGSTPAAIAAPLAFAGVWLRPVRRRTR